MITTYSQDSYLSDTACLKEKLTFQGVFMKQANLLPFQEEQLLRKVTNRPEKMV